VATGSGSAPSAPRRTLFNPITRRISRLVVPEGTPVIAAVFSPG
jgi:hypothetical protein